MPRPLVESPNAQRPTPNAPLLVVGLTGGIASGKSTIAAMFRDLGAVILNADDEGRAVVEPGEPALAEILTAFGPEFLDPEGRLRRRELGERIFARPADRETLNRITHPRIAARLRARLDSMRKLARRSRRRPVVVIEAAVLVEAGWHALVDRTVVVRVEPSVQVERLIARHGLTPPQALARLHAQLPLARRLRHADYVISGEAPLTETRRQVDAVWRTLRRQAENSPS
jgi:dephospho-CoA kinase